MLILSQLTKKSPYAKYIAAGLISLIVMSFFSFGLSTNLFKANSFMNISHAPFDGTVYPYKAVPNWSQLTDAQRDMTYSEIPKDLLLDPLEYNPSNLAKTFDEIGYGPSGENLRNQKITYSVPYMGNYKLDGKENVGSHAAVDIKLLMGTPVLSIANGVVIKAQDNPGGFGQHIVIRHSDVPSADGSGTTTYFSSYSHLSKMEVAPGDVVTKGQEIGLVGSTGTSTTPHIHFQIDNLDAPFYPYWPFSSAEAEAAGLSFFDALNEGLGKENALARTISPLKYVQAHLSVVSTSDTASTPETVEENTNDTENTVQNTEEDVVAEPLEGKVSIEAPTNMVYGQTYEVKVRYESEAGSMLAGVNPDEFTFTPSLMSSFVVPRSTSFENEEIIVPFTPKELGSLSLKVKIGNEKAYLADIKVDLFSDIPADDVDFEVFKTLKDSGIINGYADGSFGPDKNVSRVEAVKLLSFAVGAREMYLEDLPFQDIEQESWYEIYLRQAAKLGVIDLSKSEFNPHESVNRAEFLKMLFESGSEDLSQYAGENWYDTYMGAAKAKGLITAEADPSEALSRRQLARLVYDFLALN